MDLVGFGEERFDDIVRAICALGPVDAFVPLSALHGDNVVERSEAMDWYAGPALLELLETIAPATPDVGPLRLPVQLVLRDADGGRLYAGQVAGGRVAPGDEVVVLPSGRRTTIASVETLDGPLDEAVAPQSITVRLADELDVSRGDLICPVGAQPPAARELLATVCWMTDAPLRPGATLALTHTTNATRAKVVTVADRLDVTDLSFAAASELGLNDIGHVRLRTAAPILADPYAANRATGSFILVDEASNETVGAGMVEPPAA